MSKQFPMLNLTYGSPMGRATYGKPEECARRSVSLFAVALTDGYDDGGAYWGSARRGEAIYCATDGADYLDFVRAGSRADAAICPGVRRMPL